MPPGWVRMEINLIPIRDLFESHLTVTDLQRSMSFFWPDSGIRTRGGVLGAAGCLLLDWWPRQLHARSVGGRDWPPEAEPPHCVSDGSPAPAGRPCASSGRRCCSA